MYVCVCVLFVSEWDLIWTDHEIKERRHNIIFNKIFKESTVSTNIIKTDKKKGKRIKY